LTESGALRELIDSAGAFGADRSLVERAAAEFVALHLQIANLERLIDPRRRRALAEAQRIAKAARALGDRTDKASILRERFGLSKSQINRLLRTARETCADSVL
jgi:hypothetical protein